MRSSNLQNRINKALAVINEIADGELVTKKKYCRHKYMRSTPQTFTEMRDAGLTKIKAFCIHCDCKKTFPLTGSR